MYIHPKGFYFGLQCYLLKITHLSRMFEVVDTVMKNIEVKK